MSSLSLSFLTTVLALFLCMSLFRNTITSANHHIGGIASSFPDEEMVQFLYNGEKTHGFREERNNYADISLGKDTDSSESEREETVVLASGAESTGTPAIVAAKEDKIPASHCALRCIIGMSSSFVTMLGFVLFALFTVVLWRSPYDYKSKSQFKI